MTVRVTLELSDDEAKYLDNVAQWFYEQKVIQSPKTETFSRYAIAKLVQEWWLMVKNVN